MGLLSTTKSLFNKVTSGITALLDALKTVINVAVHIKDYTVGIIDDVTALIDEAKAEWDAIIHFKFVIAWKTRVVSVPRVWDNIAELIALPNKVIEAVKDFISNLTHRFKEVEAAEAVEEVIPGFGQAAGILTFIAEALVLIKQTVADLKTVVDAIQTLRKDIEDLDAIFLPNRNKRERLKLEDGGSIRIRLGSLHQA